MQKDDIRKVLARHAVSLMEIPGVAGVAVGKAGAKQCITVFATKDSPELKSLLPATIEGYPVRVAVSGDFEAFGG